LKKKNRDKNQSSNWYNNKKLNDFNSTNYTYFGCGTHVHIKADCPNNESKERGASKKLRIKEKLKEPTLLGRIMMYLPLTHQQMQMKRQINALWQRENQKQAV